MLVLYFVGFRLLVVHISALDLLSEEFLQLLVLQLLVVEITTRELEFNPQLLTLSLQLVPKTLHLLLFKLVLLYFHPKVRERLPLVLRHS